MTDKPYAIKFSHMYRKMESFDLTKPFTLVLAISGFDTSVLSRSFIEYDTAYEGGNFKLPKGWLILLILEQDHKLLTTVRPYTEDKMKFYEGLVDKQVMCRLTGGSE